MPIASFRNKALRRYWEQSEPSHLPPKYVRKIGQVLDALDAASTPRDLDVPGFGFHALKGDRRGQYAIKITPNWRITFRWHDDDAVEINFEDYHGG